jgi:uncharacterized protein (DUF1684 family)
MRSRLLATVAILGLAGVAVASEQPRASTLADDAATFEKLTLDWRAWRLERLTADTGWLTLIGLTWLEPGDYSIGAAPGSKIALPADKAPAHVGTLTVAGGKVTLHPAPGAGLTVDGKPLTEPTVLVSDAEENMTMVELGPLLRDRQSDLRLHFPGLDYFPIDPSYRVEATFNPNPPGTTIPVADIVGVTEQMPSPGKLTFTLKGHTFTITTLDDTGDGRLYLVVGDQTNGRETYGAGRFLYAPKPVDGKTIVDFNRAYNPPCAFTPWSTCQLPPRENKLPIKIEAGEKKYAGGHAG